MRADFVSCRVAELMPVALLTARYIRGSHIGEICAYSAIDSVDL